MPMLSDLPSRESFKRNGVTIMDVKPVLAAFMREELKTEAEWRDSIDWESATRMYAIMDCGVMSEEEIDDWSDDIWDDCRFGTKAIVNAALGIGDTDD